MLNVTFYGVRGSTPCACERTQRYGGNTSCVALEVPGEPPVVLDLGTGLRFFGETQPADGSFRGAALVSHLHWDHIQGLPFFAPILSEGASLDVYAPAPEPGRSVADAFDAFMRAPYFPVTLADLPGKVRFHDVSRGRFELGSASVTAAVVPHVGRTNGYRVEWGAISVAYIPDHQQPPDGSLYIDDAVLGLADGVDLLIHDAQYTAREFAQRSTWGHCTVEYALWVAQQAGVRRVALFHHDPGRSDRALDEVQACTRRFGERTGIEVIVASERLTVSLSDAAAWRYEQQASGI